MHYALFRGNSNKKEALGLFISREAAWVTINQTLKNEGIEPYYFRQWGDEVKEVTIDYGSHSDFFYIEVIK